ncbi:unnamed protein product [Symbiodinium microadriaticum]|nr:unnamed protein product [Symbiodinium microadriaticum]
MPRVGAVRKSVSRTAFLTVAASARLFARGRMRFLACCLCMDRATPASREAFAKKLWKKEGVENGAIEVFAAPACAAAMDSAHIWINVRRCATPEASVEVIQQPCYFIGARDLPIFNGIHMQSSRQCFASFSIWPGDARGIFDGLFTVAAPSPICSRGHPNAQSKLNNPTHQVWVRRHVLGIAIVESEAKEMEKLVASKSMPNASHRNTSSKSSVIRCDKQQMAPTAQPHDASRRWEGELQKLQAEVSHFQHGSKPLES